MDWYSGSIPEAVAEVKRHQKLLLVFVEGDDELSKTMTDAFNNSEVCGKLNSSNCVALKLTVNSVPYQQFSDIYPVVVIPSSYFIGKNGLPIEIITGSLEPEHLLEKIDKILKQEMLPPSESLTPLSSNCNAEAMESSDIDNSVQNGCENQASTSNSAEGTNDPADLEDKLERAKSLIKVVRENKAIEEKEDWLSSSSARKKCVSSQQVAETSRKRIRVDETDELPKERADEVQRRRMGKEIQKAQQDRHENELKEWAQSRAKEKEEERLARERVRAQIAQDRAERAARYQQSKADESSAQKERDAARIKEEQERASRDAAMRSSMARLQFRLPDGTSIVQQFSPDSTLQEARNFVLEHVRSSLTTFTLCTTFPRRHFTEANYSETLRDLQLAPSAAILVLPGQTDIVTNGQGGFFVSMFWNLVSPLLAVWRTITSFFHRAPPAPPPPPTSTTTTTSTTTSTATTSQAPQAEKQSREPGASDGHSSDGPAPKRRNLRKFYKEGNVYRINQRADDEEDNNTWNGNSTQQM